MVALAEFFSRLARRYLPDPLVIAILLTVASIVLALIFGRSSPLDVITYWGEGFWGLLEFGMQVVLIILTGYLLASTPAADRILDRLASIPTSPKTAVAMAVFVTGVASWFQWGFGLIVGTLIAQKIAVNVRDAHYPLVIAGAYGGFVIYGAGMSATIPLTVATPGHFLEEQMGIETLSETIFHPVVLALSIFTIVTLPFFMAMLHPKDPAKVIPIDPETVRPPEEPPVDPESMGLGQRLNRHWFGGVVTGTLGLIYSVIYFFDGGQLNLNSVNFIFLMLAFLLFARPSRFLAAMAEGVKTVGGVIVQYPFYAGIMGIMTGSGLVVMFSDLFVQVSDENTLPLWTFLSAGLINVLIPSGGGQWAIQGPVMIEAANAVGASGAATAVAASIGDGWTNMLTPMFLLPVLAISKLKLQDVMGYVIMVLFYAAVVMGVAMLILGFMTS
ncbi:short-chain fatty acid transporter [Nesterenkonia ebinurensis]|uniref:short-chain fatty acid transporter n=1 Tax=Nesterenkonia ebinurensis TaxID=2608252 RepID=UPI00123CBAAE|nr:TIGR00366 family protein [Nesterenkonia ebinurensis]